MKVRFLLWGLGAWLWCACSGHEDVVDAETVDTCMPVLFSAGNSDVALTRASASYMPLNSRFVCSMFFHAGVNDTDSSDFYTDAPDEEVNMYTTWLKINNSVGNAVYWNAAYDSATVDSYGFDTDAQCFYWQNRKNHVFLALADYHQLSTDDGSDSGSLKLYPDISEQYNGQYMKQYDLTRGEKSSIDEQPDPILAVQTTSPSGATPEANRVKLFFQHQFSQIQVNLKNAQDASVAIDSALIESVELLGVAEVGYVPYCIEPDGSVPNATSEPIDYDDAKYAATLADNPYGSSFSLFVRPTTVAGYLKSFEGIAFGTLQGIRITWKESADANAVSHVATYKGVKNLSLQSGTKYIYNMELRRSLIAQVKAEIVSWNIDQTEYEADGTIQND